MTSLDPLTTPVIQRACFNATQHPREETIKRYRPTTLQLMITGMYRGVRSWMGREDWGLHIFKIVKFQEFFGKFDIKFAHLARIQIARPTRIVPDIKRDKLIKPIQNLYKTLKNVPSYKPIKILGQEWDVWPELTPAILQCFDLKTFICNLKLCKTTQLRIYFRLSWLFYNLTPH